MNRSCITLSIVSICFVARVTATAASPYFLGLGDLPGGNYASESNAISADGRFVVGDSHSSGPNGESGFQAFLWSKDTGMLGLGDLAGGDFQSLALGVCTNGTVVGSSRSAIGDEPFRWTASTGMVSLGGLPGGTSASGVAYDISASGNTIVGGTDYLPDASIDRAFSWTETSGMSDLGTLPNGTGSVATAISADGSTIAGIASGGSLFRWTAGSGMVSLGTLPLEFNGGNVYGISADGRYIVGTLNRRTGTEFLAFYWTEDLGFTILGDLPGGMLSSSAYAVSEAGTVIVGRATTDAGTTAFIWDPIHGMRDLRIVLIADYGLDLSDWSLRTPWGMTPDGTTIVGGGNHVGFGSEAWIVHIPEPQTACLLLIGTGLLRQRRRR